MPNHKSSRKRKKKLTPRKTNSYKITGSLKWKDNKGTFYKTIIVGVILAVFLHLFFLNTKLGEESVNKIFDLFLIKREAEQRIKTTAIPNNEIVFITIYPKENQLLTPRDEIAKAVRIAYKAGAKVIIPDFLFESPDYQQPEADLELRRVFMEVSDKPGVSLILPVRIGYQQDIKTNIFNDIIEDSSNIYGAIPAITSTDKEDPYGRYWRAYETGKYLRKQKILWGLPLIAAVLAGGDIKELEKFEPRILKGKMSKARLMLTNKSSICMTGEKEDRYYQRIRYLLIPSNTMEDKIEGNISLYENFPLDKVELMEDKAKIFQDKIVIIGNNHPDFGDMHLTPVGEMPGMYLLGNAIYTLMKGLQVSGAPFWLNLIFDLFIIIFSAFFFTYLPILISGVFRAIDISLLLSILEIVLSFLFIHFVGYGLYMCYGIFPKSNLLIFMIGFYETVVNFEELLSNASVKWLRKE